jgi:hypothetical protein
MIKLTVEEGVYDIYNGLASAACRWLNKKFPVRHNVKMWLVTSKFFKEYFKEYPSKTVGLYFPQKLIVISQAKYSKARVLAYGRQYKSAYDAFLYVIMHEFCHYEQDRDGKNLTHRGVVSRGKKLVKEFKKDWLNERLI